YFKKYIKPTLILLPINILKDFIKPLSLSFQLFGNILADDELVVVVLVSLVPLVVPILVLHILIPDMHHTVESEALEVEYVQLPAEDHQ
ncbi:hypothetical protein SETIT_6G110000v2, partial [Setaria italica]